MMPACSHVARPLPRLPALFETSVSSFTPRSTTPRINASGLPDSPKPPTRIVMPSRSGSSAWAIEATTLSPCCPRRIAERAQAADQLVLRDAQRRREDRGTALAVDVQRQLARGELAAELG